MPTLRSVLRWFANLGVEMGDPVADAINVGNEWYAQGNFDQAIAEYDEAIRLNPKFAQAYYSRGACWLARSQFEKAIEEFSTAIRLDPEFSLAWTGRGQAWYCLKKYELVLQDLAEAIRLDPNSAENYLFRGHAWLEKQELERAQGDYNEAIRIDPSNAPSYCCRGLIRYFYVEFGGVVPKALPRDGPVRPPPLGSVARLEYEKALEDMGNAIRLDPAHAKFFAMRAWVWRALFELDHAIDDYSEAIRLNPKYVYAYVHRGHVWRDKLQYDRAIADFETVLQLTPDDQWATESLAWLFGSALDDTVRDGERATQLAQRALMLDAEKAPWTMDTLAVAYAEAGDFKTAIAWEERALESAPAHFEPAMRERLELFRRGQPYRQRQRGLSSTHFKPATTFPQE